MRRILSFRWMPPRAKTKPSFSISVSRAVYKIWDNVLQNCLFSPNKTPKNVRDYIWHKQNKNSNFFYPKCGDKGNVFVSFLLASIKDAQIFLLFFRFGINLENWEGGEKMRTPVTGQERRLFLIKAPSIFICFPKPTFVFRKCCFTLLFLSGSS